MADIQKGFCQCGCGERTKLATQTKARGATDACTRAISGPSRDNGACVRPDHLFLGTQADNMRDMDAKGRRGTHRRLA